MYQVVKRLPICLVLVLLASCGGDGLTGSSTSATGSTSTSTSTGAQIGSGSGASFVNGTLAIGISTSLSAGGSTSVTANVVDKNGSPYSTSVDVAFTSTCVGSGTASLITPVTTVNGVATSTYAALGCSGTDLITATATVDGEALVATGSVTVLPASIGSVEFVSATPKIIGLKGTGGAGLPETSAVIFKVSNQSGGPVANQDVTFSLDTTIGGLAIVPASGKTDNNGEVRTIVQSGTVATTVRVKASIASPAISTQSSELSVTTGVPDQDSVSLSAEILNPEAWTYDGVTVKVTARLADRYNNPAANGTAVTFTTEGGSIGGSCVTTDGACSVDWISQQPRPIGGRVTLLASAIGEESYVDANATGTFDGSDTFSDLGEAYRDDDESGTYNANELFVDYTKDGVYTAADGKFNGVLCGHATLCSTVPTVSVSDSLVLVMSGSQIGISFSPVGTIAAALTGTTVTVTMQDVNGQFPPAGSNVTVATTNGKLGGPSSFVVPSSNSNGPYTFNLTLTADGAASSGTLTVTLVTPKLTTSSASVAVTD